MNSCKIPLRYPAGFAASALLLLGLVPGAQAAPPAKPACGTNGPLVVSDLNADSYNYTQGESGTLVSAFTVMSPPLNITGGCDAALLPVYGNGKSEPDARVVAVALAVGEVTVLEPLGAVLSDAQVQALRAAISLSPGTTILDNPGSGSFAASLAFTKLDLPAGEYAVGIEVRPQDGVGLGGTVVKSLFVTVTEPTQVDTQAPILSITNPTEAPRLCVNSELALGLSAVDPLENGAGTGVWALRGALWSAGGLMLSDLPGMAVSPALWVAAGEPVSAQAMVSNNAPGQFLVKAEADDNAGHTGLADTAYSVGLNVVALPPMSLGKAFKPGATLPIKWNFGDCDGQGLPPFASVRLVITDPSGYSEQRWAGDGAANIRWELDDAGNVTHYISNYPIPMAGHYQVDLYVDDVDGASMLQGSLSFDAQAKGK
ncbi:hypothetical protein [Gallaecimonas xiamenensis]|uniref:PKD domain-containing protein n=1 Tax=Gallaecimonas xiamenensis 3-C-1 TaxID=745411 RepID=K2IWV9_9GAMM|nr:hypothetical protein [Gallaecimonas xiamenensis]EKE74976.1 hypothetical protein B3C1_08811 [Gallaecimonas xiamenensis 3-C-1]